jgi:hypothetical protein
MSKELLNFMTWVNQDEKLGYTSIGIERIVNRYITSKDLIIRDAYQNYVKTHRVGFLGIKNTIMSQEEFINKCKTDDEFSEKWGLKIEERELSLIERNNFLGDKKYTMLDGDYIWPTMIEDKEKYEKIFNETNIPTKLITITYNDKTIESYE